MTSQYYVLVNNESRYLKTLLLLNRYGFKYRDKKELLDADPKPLLKTYPDLCIGIDYQKRAIFYSPKVFYERLNIEEIKFERLEYRLEELSNEEV